MSLVWNYAIRRKNPITKELTGECKACDEVIKCSDRSITSLKNHMKAIHKIDIDALEAESKKGDSNLLKKPKKIKSIQTYFPSRTLHSIVADLATDGISIRAITRNKYIRESIQKDGFNLPANESDVMKLIHVEYQNKKELMVNEIQQKLSNGIKFSMTFDEYTTIRHRRYIGINIHDSSQKKTYNTGLVRIMGSCPASALHESIDSHLNSFGLSLKSDIIASTQDGAAVNKKFMRQTNLIEQYCINHGLHLAVCDTLYKNSNRAEIDIQNDFISADNECNDFFDNNDVEIIAEVTDETYDYKDVLKNTRKLVKFIKNSSVRNQIFQSKVKEQIGKEIELQLDVQHRWNSIFDMVDPIIKAKKCLFEACAELNAFDLINSVDFEALMSLKNALYPVEVAVKALSRKDANLSTADTIINFMLKKVSELNTDISSSLHKNLSKRVNERINSDVINLVRSLKDPCFAPSKNVIQFAGKLGQRLFGFTELETDVEVHLNNDVNQERQMSLQEELDFLLSKDNSVESSKANDEFKWIKQEFILFKNTGKRTENLDKLFNCLLAIKPTSTDVERVFSVCTNFCTKIRSRLSDVSLNALLFLKYYYGKK